MLGDSLSVVSDSSQMVKYFAKFVPTLVSTTFSVVPSYLMRPEHVLHNYARFPYHHTLSDGAKQYSIILQLTRPSRDAPHNPRRSFAGARATFELWCGTH